jgi:hypothetical protein
VCFLFVLFGLLFLSTEPKFPINRPGQPAAPARTNRLVTNYGKLPLSFEVNQGQADKAVKFLSRGRGYGLFLTGDEAVLTLGRARQKSKGKSQKATGKADAPTLESAEARVAPPFRAARAGLKPSATTPVDKPTTDHTPWTTDSIFRMKLVGANSHAAVTGAAELPGKSNYFIGNDPRKWRTNVPTYAQVKYQGVYPGVDLVYYGNQGGQLEYDFVVAPGADPSAIRLGLSGGREESSRQSAVGSRPQNQTLPQSKIQNPKFKIAANGDLVVETGGGDIRLHKPVVYQELFTVDSSQLTVQDEKRNTTDNPKSKIQNRKFLEGHYVLTASNQIRFALGAYDRTKPLVIDPILSYSTYLGGDNTDAGNGIAVDSSGNAYVTGSTTSTDFPLVNPIPASYEGNEAGYDAFVFKLNTATSALVYSTYLGGLGTNYGAGVAVHSGYAYVTGYTNASDFPTVNPVQGTCSQCSEGQPDAFVAKLDPAGSALVYSTYLGGTKTSGGAASSTEGTGIAVDVSGHAFVTGFTNSVDFPTANPIQATCLCAGESDTTSPFVTEYNMAGSAYVYSTYLGAVGQGSGIAVDSSHNAYVTGQGSAQNIPDTNPSCPSTECAFVTKINVQGVSVAYSTNLGGNGASFGNAIAVDSSGNAYVTGVTRATNFPTANPIQATCTIISIGCSSAFVTKLNATGTALVYSTYLSPNSQGNGIAVDSSGNASVTGWTQSTEFPNVSPLPITLSPANQYAFVTKLNAAGTALLYSTLLSGSNAIPGSGGVNGDEGNAIAADSAGNTYVTGQTDSTSFPVTPTALQSGLKEGGNCYLLSGPSFPCPEAFVVKLSPAPYANLSGPSISFGNVLFGATSSTQSVTLTAGGDAPFNLNSISASDAFALVNTGTSCPYGGGSVAFQTQCTINVSFTPTATGNFTGTVTITDNAPGSPQTIALTGAGIVAAPTVTPGSLTFSNQTVGTASASKPVTVTNNGPVAMSFASLAISTGWTQSNNCLPSVAANASCTINVSFQPTSTGSLTGALTLTDYSANSPQTITLSGTGILPAVSLSATSLTFDGQTVSTSSASQPIVLKNTGAGTLTSLAFAVTGDFAQTHNCKTPIAPNASCTINVTFTPTATGARTGALTLTDNAANSPQTITLSGTGVLPVVSLSPTSLTFAGQTVSTTSASQPIILKNTGAGVVTSLTIAASGDFAQTHNCKTPIGSGDSCTINVTFTPTATGNRTGALTLTDNAANSPQKVTLTGTGL